MHHISWTTAPLFKNCNNMTSKNIFSYVFNNCVFKKCARLTSTSKLENLSYAMPESPIRPCAILQDKSDLKYALIHLNTKFDSPESKNSFRRLWKRAKYRAIVDGAINELYKLASEEHEQDQLRPDVISGDFDSAEPHILQYYRDRDVEIVPTPDQNETDFTKSIRLVLQEKRNAELDCIVAFVKSTGRTDHVFGNLQTLFLARNLSDKPVYLSDGTSLTFLLPQGNQKLQFGTGYEGDWCGLIPVGGPVSNVSTTGLKWNLENQTLCFGELVSTSNMLTSSEVTVKCSGPLLWTMGLKQSCTKSSL